MRPPMLRHIPRVQSDTGHRLFPQVERSPTIPLSPGLFPEGGHYFPKLGPGSPSQPPPPHPPPPPPPPPPPVVSGPPPLPHLMHPPSPPLPPHLHPSLSGHFPPPSPSPEEDGRPFIEGPQPLPPPPIVSSAPALLGPPPGHIIDGLTLIHTQPQPPPHPPLPPHPLDLQHPPPPIMGPPPPMPGIPPLQGHPLSPDAFEESVESFGRDFVTGALRRAFTQAPSFPPPGVDASRLQDSGRSAPPPPAPSKTSGRHQHEQRQRRRGFHSPPGPAPSTTAAGAAAAYTPRSTAFDHVPRGHSKARVIRAQPGSIPLSDSEPEDWADLV